MPSRSLRGDSLAQRRSGQRRTQASRSPTRMTARQVRSLPGGLRTPGRRRLPACRAMSAEKVVRTSQPGGVERPAVSRPPRARAVASGGDSLGVRRGCAP
jgi:hypothetical protein